MEDEFLGPLSTLRSIKGIDPVQTVYFEAIGFGIDVVDMVYRRLAAMLTNVPPPTLAFADAWAIIDWMYRLDGLVRGCRGLTQRDEAVVDFLNSSSLTETMRHIYEHPATELHLTAESQRSIWGHLAWQIKRTDGHVVSQITPFSRWEGREFRQPAGHDQPPRATVDRISLFSPDGEAEIGLTGQWEAAVRFGARLDAALQASERPGEGEVMKVRTWFPAGSHAVWPELSRRMS